MFTLFVEDLCDELTQTDLRKRYGTFDSSLQTLLGENQGMIEITADKLYPSRQIFALIGESTRSPGGYGFQFVKVLLGLHRIGPGQGLKACHSVKHAIKSADAAFLSQFNGFPERVEIVSKCLSG